MLVPEGTPVQLSPSYVFAGILSAETFRDLACVRIVVFVLRSPGKAAVVVEMVGGSGGSPIDRPYSRASEARCLVGGQHPRNLGYHCSALQPSKVNMKDGQYPNAVSNL